MSTAPTVLTVDDVRNALRLRYPLAALFVFDRTYNVPHPDAIHTYLLELRQWLNQEYGDKWQAFADCDNFSLEAVSLANRKHRRARMAGLGSAEGISFGILGYMNEPGRLNTGHMIAFWVDAQRRVHEFEPQTRHVLPLTAAQCQSAFFAAVF